MRNSRRELRLLVLSVVVVLGLMAFVAAPAGADWLFSVPNQPVNASTHTEFNLKVKEFLNLEVLCATTESEDLLLLSGTGTAKGKVKVKGCKTWISGKDSTANCQPIEPIVVAAKAKLVLHGGKNYILVEPEIIGGNFTLIKFNEEKCALASNNSVKGFLVAECAELSEATVVGVDCAKASVMHLLQPNEALFTEDKFTLGGNAATLNGVLSVALVSGYAWSGHI